MNLKKYEFFIYAIAPTTVGASSSEIATIRIGANKFLVEKLTGSATSPDNISILIKITNQNKDLSNTSILFNDLIGSAQRPSIIPAGTLIFDENQNIDLLISNTSGSSNTVSIAFIGYKIRE